MKHCKINIDGQTKKFKVPQGWHELTMSMFCNLTDLHMSDEEVKPSQVIAAILGLPHEDVLRIDASSLDVNVYYHLMFLEDVDGFEIILNTKPSDRFQVGVNKYKLLKDFSKMTLGQKEEATQIINNKDEQPLLDKAFDLLGLFYPDMNKKSFEDAPAKEMYPIVDFFLIVLSSMQSISTAYLKANQVLRRN